MDFKMTAMKRESETSIWECKVVNGIVPLISGDEENQQTATLAGLLIRGSIPQLPNVGVPWTDYLNKNITFGELDYYIRQSIIDSGETNYYPDYNIENDKLTMSIGKTEENNEL